MAKSHSSIGFVALCNAYGLPAPMGEFRFHPTRQWLFDWIFPNWWIAVEVQGGIWKRGHHSRGQGQLDDFEKLNVAQCMGWIVLQITPSQIDDGSFAQIIRNAIAYRAHENAMWDDETRVEIPDHVFPCGRGPLGDRLPF